VEALILKGGLEVATIQTAPLFKRLRVSDGQESTIVDLVAEPWPSLRESERLSIQGVEVPVDSMHEILVSKLCALIGRQEPRDLFDTAELVTSGADLARAIADAPLKDGGFSPLILAWTIKSIDLQTWASVERVDPETLSRLESFRKQLIETLI
jgi:hypothetical protein